MIPENRLRVYDIREVIKHLADDDSVLELRPKYGVGMITAFIRIEGRPMGLIANDSRHLGGAIDGDDADKAARFIQVCDAYDIPVLSLCDTPGFMVGPEAEKTSLVRRVSRMFVQGANADIPFFCIILRKGWVKGAFVFEWESDGTSSSATASARKQWPQAPSMPPCSLSPGLPVNSAGWVWKAPSALRTGTS